MDITKAPGTLMIDVVGNSKVCEISLNIPRQIIYLRSYRIQFDTIENALANPILYIDVPWLSGNQLIDTNPGYVYLPLFVDNAVVTFTFGKSIPVFLSRDIDKTFQIRILDSTFLKYASPSSLKISAIVFSSFISIKASKS